MEWGWVALEDPPKRSVQGQHGRHGLGGATAARMTYALRNGAALAAHHGTVSTRLLCIIKIGLNQFGKAEIRGERIRHLSQAAANLSGNPDEHPNRRHGARVCRSPWRASCHRSRQSTARTVSPRTPSSFLPPAPPSPSSHLFIRARVPPSPLPCAPPPLPCNSPRVGFFRMSVAAPSSVRLFLHPRAERA